MGEGVEGVERALSIAYLDTHIAGWLHDGRIGRLSKEAKRHIDRDELLFSPMAFLELQYLHDRKRIREGAKEIYSHLNAMIGLRLCTIPFPAVAMEAVYCTWIDDPFDRIIVSQAKANGEAGLITSDLRIRENYAATIW